MGCGAQQRAEAAGGGHLTGFDQVHRGGGGFQERLLAGPEQGLIGPPCSHADAQRVAGHLPGQANRTLGTAAQLRERGGELLDEGAEQPEPHPGMHVTAGQGDDADAHRLLGAPVHHRDRILHGDGMGVRCCPGEESAAGAHGLLEATAVVGAGEGHRELGD